jgi:hypothetical protein
MEMLLRVPKGSPSELAVALLISGVSEFEADWVRPSFFPTVPKFRAMAVVPVVAAAPSVQAVIERVGGFGLVLASEPSGLKVIVIGPPPLVPVSAAVGSEAGFGLPKPAVQVFVPVLVQVSWTEFGAPS